MNDNDDSSNIAGLNEDLDTTPPNPAGTAIPAPTTVPPQQGKWEMPKPVFRKSSGQLPQNFEKRYFQSDGSSASDDGVPPSSENSSTPVVEEQPELAEILIPEPDEVPATASVPEAKKGASSLLFPLFGFVVVLTFIAVFLALIYFLFLRPQSSGSVF